VSDRVSKHALSGLESCNLLNLFGDPTGNRTPVSGVRELQYHPINAEAPGFSLQGIQENTLNT